MYKELLTKYQSLLLSEEEGSRIMMEALTEAEKISLSKGAPINQNGEIEYTELFDIKGYANFGIHVRDELLKRLPPELVAISIKLRPKHHLGRWNHIQAVMEAFWCAYVDLKIEV